MNRNSKFKIQNLENFILDIILPKKCLHCQKEKIFLCPDCFKLIQLNSFQVCPVCEKSLTEKGEICRYCKTLKPPLDSLTVAVNYEDSLISKLIHSFKYKFIEELSEPLTELLIKTIKKNKLFIPDLIIPVPLHPLRLRWRGFNQSELLAQNLAQKLLPNLSIEVDSTTLKRVKYTLTQAHLKNAKERQENIQNAFEVDLNSLEKIKNRRILLIDDICTTGNTLFECATELRKLKPKTIQALVVGRKK